MACIQEVEIHPSFALAPHVELCNCHERDILALARTASAVHAYGALAGTGLCPNGLDQLARRRRAVSLRRSSLPVIAGMAPVQVAAWDRRESAGFPSGHRTVGRRALRAGFALGCVSAGHGLTRLGHFFTRPFNQKTDVPGGSLENRARLLRQQTRMLSVDHAAVAAHLVLGENLGTRSLEPSETRELVAMLADLWDFCLAGWGSQSPTSRSAAEEFAEQALARSKTRTSKPVVSAGRSTSPDATFCSEGSGPLGAARPSIADPFLPSAIRQERFAEIRECIGGNIYVFGDFTVSLIRPARTSSMDEKWRCGWHPERIQGKGEDARVLMVEAGPAGHECALGLQRCGHEVSLARARAKRGGRFARKRRLRGLAVWMGVRNWRMGQTAPPVNVGLDLLSSLEVADGLECGADAGIVATRVRGRTDGVGRFHAMPRPLDPLLAALAPNTLLAGSCPARESVVIVDGEHVSRGGVFAEGLQRAGFEVHRANPGPSVSPWTRFTLEQSRIQARLLDLGARLHQFKAGISGVAGEAELTCVFTGKRERLAGGALIPLTSRVPEDRSRELLAAGAGGRRHAIDALLLIGDARTPTTIALAAHAGRRAAEELDGSPQRRLRCELLRPAHSPTRA